MYKYWKEIRIVLFAVTATFIAGILLGLIMPETVKIWFLKEVGEKFADITSEADSIWFLGVLIFWNNLLVTFLLFVSSIFLVIPIFILLSNGLVIGIFLDMAWRLNVLTPGTFLTTLAALLPHGIFEIPAFILSAAFGLSLMLKIIFGNKILSVQNRTQALAAYIKGFLFIILPLLICAAILEVTVSDYLMNYLQNRNQTRYQDQSLALELDKDFMINNQCHVALGYNDYDGFEEVFSRSNTLLYDKELMARLKPVARWMHWQQKYECKNGSFSVTTYNSHNYTLAQAQYNQKLLWQKLGYKNNSQDLGYFVNEVEGKVVVVVVKGVDKKLLTKIKSLL